MASYGWKAKNAEGWRIRASVYVVSSDTFKVTGPVDDI